MEDRGERGGRGVDAGMRRREDGRRKRGGDGMKKTGKRVREANEGTRYKERGGRGKEFEMRNDIKIETISRKVKFVCESPVSRYYTR